MELISILEIVGGIPEDLEVFPVYEEQLRDEVAQKADEYFEKTSKR